jgi:hypothetical protein
MQPPRQVNMTEPGFQLHQIRITESAIAEVVGRQALVSIPRSEVRGLRLGHGIIAERPFLLGGIGVALTVLGVLGVGNTAMAFFHPTTSIMVPGRLLAGLVLAAIFGPVALYAALRRGWTLIVDTTTSSRKLGFGAPVTAAELGELVDAARAAGIPVEVGAAVPRANVVNTRS